MSTVSQLVQFNKHLFRYNPGQAKNWKNKNGQTFTHFRMNKFTRYLPVIHTHQNKVTGQIYFSLSASLEAYLKWWCKKPVQRTEKKHFSEYIAFDNKREHLILLSILPNTYTKQLWVRYGSSPFSKQILRVGFNF